jgi:DNA-binding NtrC family response regulator
LARILVIEDEPVLAENICASLEHAGWEAVSAGNGEDGLDAEPEFGPDVILLDLRLPGIDGMEVLRTFSERGTAASIVIMTAHGNVRSAVEAMKGGASDFLSKPLDLDELQLVIKRALSHRRLTAQLDYFRSRQQAGTSTQEIIGRSPPMTRVKMLIDRLVATPALASDVPPSVLLTGETGTGKDLAARAIHYAGARREGPFIQVNCTALPENLVEAELFGYVRGAFTDARKDKRGLLESGDGGTVFLDEIGHMPLGIQAKLLSALEHRKIRPVGGTSERAVDIHVIAATNRDLDQAIRENQFREDLYHRLRVVRIEMPPLRDRGDDVISLAGHFLGLYVSRFGLNIERFTDDALALLREYDWPGNVRELSHTIESAVLMCPGTTVGVDQLNIKPQHEPGGMQIDGDAIEGISIDFARGTPKLEEIEERIIRAALQYARYNVSRTARILGVTRDAVRYRLAKYDKGPGKE